MTPERWRRIEALYHAALTRRESERSAFLAEASADDDALRCEVESLLAQPAEHFLAGPAVAAAQLPSPRSASVAVGSRLGVYQLEALLGIGGMGTVYRARDTRLGREVALKILPHEFTADPDRLVRFGREARILAALNHPTLPPSMASRKPTGCMHSSWNSSKAKRWPIASRGDRCQSRKCCRLRNRSLRRSNPPTNRASFTAISNRRTSNCDQTAPSRRRSCKSHSDI